MSSGVHPASRGTVTQYWDHDRVFSHLMGEHDLASIVCDYLAVDIPEQLWTAAPPQPGFQGGPVVRAVTGAGQFPQALTAPVAECPNLWRQPFLFHPLLLHDEMVLLAESRL